MIKIMPSVGDLVDYELTFAVKLCRRKQLVTTVFFSWKCENMFCIVLFVL